MSRTTKEDVVRAAGRLFAERGYHGTSMRKLGQELGLLGSSLYSHVEGKQDLLVEVVRRGASFFQASAEAAYASGGSAADRLRALIAGHLAVTLDHRAEVRTYLNEAFALDEDHRREVIAARDRYEGVFRRVLSDGVRQGAFGHDIDPKTAAIFILSVLNAVDRWYREDGTLDRDGLTAAAYRFVSMGLVGT